MSIEPTDKQIDDAIATLNPVQVEMLVTFHPGDHLNLWHVSLAHLGLVQVLNIAPGSQLPEPVMSLTILGQRVQQKLNGGVR